MKHGTKQNRRLDRRQSAELYQLVVAKREYIESTRDSWDTVAAKFGNILGFEVSSYTVRECALDAKLAKKAAASPGGGDGRTLRPGIAASVHKQTRHDATVIAKVLYDLCVALGHTEAKIKLQEIVDRGVGKVTLEMFDNERNGN